MEKVVLIFPPLVETSFGRYFPSLAVLAGYLENKGIKTQQWDLNAEFALHLLAPDHLAAAGQGRRRGLSESPLDGLDAVAGRWLSSHQHVLFDADGRHNFASPTGPAFLLSELAKPYLVDPDKEWLTDPTLLQGSRTLIFREFYEKWGVGRQLPDSARLVGISVPMGPQLVPALLLANAVKQARPDLKVVLGGPTLSLMDESSLSSLLKNHPQVDAVVRFDGEIPLTTLCEQAHAGPAAADGDTPEAFEMAWHPAEVPGVSTVVDGVVVHVPPAPGLHPNMLPPAKYDPALLGRLVNPEIGIVQARGCYWGKCDYCDFVELYDGSPPYRGRSVKTFLAELEHLVETHGVRHFELITESIPPAFARRFAQEVIDRGLDIVWNSFAMVDRRFDAELLELMVRSGCEHLVVGMETTVTRVLKLVHKSADREENLRFMREAHRAGMKLRINLIPDLPSTTMAEAMESLRDVSEVADCVESFAVFPFEATRSSEVGRAPERFGLIPADDLSGTDHQAQYALNHLGNIDPAMTDEERREVHRAYREFAARHHTAPMQETGDRFLDAPPAVDEHVRLGLDFLDILPQGDHLIVTHVLRRERTVLPPAVVRGLRPWLDGAPFTRQCLVEANGPVWAERVLEQLIDARMLAGTAVTSD